MIAQRMLGRAVDLSNLEVVLPVQRVAHPAVDTDGRQVGENNVVDPLGAVDFLFKPVVAEILQSKAVVFVELQRRAAQVARQSELLRAAERREHERVMEEERRRWDEEALRR